ncbi:MAG: HAMP domain-containing histidine kinase, partial [Bacteroidales bacterium]|nr:HAMP domain-containing histidine kinase [Bacteroidales bacterium]
QIHYRLRFRLFKSNYLLNLEQQKTRALYNETLQINNELEQKANEAIVIKEEIEKKNEELNMSNATKDRFLGIIAHDLKNPISAIWGLSDLLLVDDKMDKKQKNECVDTINKCVKHTHGLLENLLNWAMAQNKSISHNPFVHNANVIVENELKILRQVADKKQIKIENNVPADFNIYADLNMFETIIRNLVSNAIKYTYPNGHIKINARIVNDNNILYSEIAVADNGVGMVSDKIEKLFQITKDISTRGTENEEGTGLGLLLCKEFVELHNGTINVDSTPGKGSVFRFVIPVVNVHKNN